jgi:hypothetical protein
MNSETKVCQNCKKDFIFDPQELELLEKLKMPLPSFCAPCQMIERMIWRNERTLYKRPSNAPGAIGDIVSIYSPLSPVVVYDSKTWWGDGWDSAEYGLDYDFSKPFFHQFGELIKKVPFPALQNWNAVNSDYCNCTSDNKNCYMVFGGDFNEDSLYSMYNIHTKNVCDVYWLEESEFCYELIASERCHRVSYGMYVRDCIDSMFLYDCVNCSNCIGCVGLRNRSYSILNEQYTKEGYVEAVRELKLHTYLGRESFREKFEILKKNTPVRFAYLIKTQNSTGDRLSNVKDCSNCFDVVGPAENLKDCFNAGWNAKDMLRASQAGYGTELIYNSFGVFSAAQRVLCSAYTPSSMNVLYSYNCPNGSNLFGCVGVKKGEYMILNKKYTKEEYQILVPKIVEHMKEMPYVDAHGRTYIYGDFFPAELSMFTYNESVAQDIETLTEEEIIKSGYQYQARLHSEYSISIKNESIPDTLPSSFDDLKKEIIECANKGSTVYCSGAFRITAEEFAFYQQMGIPVPHYCFNCRHYARFAEIRSMTLRSQVCDCNGIESKNGAYSNTAVHTHGQESCPVEFQTAYPENTEKTLYCESCYQKEIL